MGLCGQNICYHLASFMISLNLGGVGESAGQKCATTFLHFDSNLFNMQLDHVLKRLNSDLLTPGSGNGDERGSAGKIFATMLLHSWFP